MSLTSKRVYQFGEFELRVSARLLVREGRHVPLGSKAFEVLTCLVMHAGEVVTKDQLLKTVWPEAFVEEGNLSQHVFALRKALGDRSRYIVTVPGRGYQFTEAVREVPVLPPAAADFADPGPFLVQKTRERTHMVIEETASLPLGSGKPELISGVWRDGYTQTDVAASEMVTTSVRSSMQIAITQDVADHGGGGDREGKLRMAPPFRRKTSLLIGVVAVCVVVGAVAVSSQRGGKQYRHPTSQKVVLAELDNRTGDPDFDVVLQKALAIDLDQSPYLDVMSESEALGTLHLMGRKPDTELSPQVAREVCERRNGVVVIASSVARLGRQYVLTLDATDCTTGRSLAEAKAQAASKEETLTALDTAADKLRHELGESAQSVKRFEVPVAQATTSSLEALKQYSIGEYLLGRMSREESEVLPFFQRAVELDPQFAMAYAAIATSYHAMNEDGLAAPYYKKAFDLSDQVSEKERLYIRAHYYADDLHDVEQGIKAYRIWAETYPRDWGPWLNIANEDTQLGRYPEAIAAGEQALKLDSSRGIVYSVLARAYLHVNRYADARSTAEHALALGKDSSLLHAVLFEVGFVERDEALIARETAWSQGKASEWSFLRLQAAALASEGRMLRAEELFDAAYKLAVRNNLLETSDGILVEEASAELVCGHIDAARLTLDRLRRRSGDPEVARLKAQLGDVAFALRFLGAEGAASHQATRLAYVDAPRIRAAVALHLGRPADAVADLGPAAEYGFAGGFDVVAERGEAYLRKGEPEKAAIEFREILSHQGVDAVSPLFPAAYLGLARAEAQAGHVDQSRAAYDSLFAWWKQADADLPVLVSARAEYAELDGKELARK